MIAPVTPSRRRGGAALLLGLLLAVGASPAVVVATAPPASAPAVGMLPAADDGSVTWGVAPGNDTEYGADRANYAYQLDPGDQVHDVLEVTNRSTETTLHLAVYGADGLTTTSGQLDLLPADQQSVDLGAWVVPGLAAVDVAPGATVQVPFAVTVPADATPGDHSGGIVTSLSSADTEDSTVRLDRRLALRMHVRVSGELAPGVTISDLTVQRQAAVNPFAGDTLVVSYRITNSGNTRLLPTDAVAVSGLLGGERIVDVSGDEPVEVLAGDTLDREVTVAGVRVWGKADVRVQVSASAVGAGSGESVTDSVHRTVTAIPWALVALAALVLAVLVWPMVRALRRHRRTPAGQPGAGPGVGATVGPDLDAVAVVDTDDAAADPPAPAGHETVNPEPPSSAGSD